MLTETWSVLVCMFVICLSEYVSSQRRGGASQGLDPGVQEIVVPMCNNYLPYNLTKLPNRFGHRTQLKVYKRLERLWASMDNGCSPNLRLLACSMYLPKYDPVTGQTIGPCKSTCKVAKRRCRRTMDRWPRQFRCRRMPTDESTCIAPLPQDLYQSEHAYCAPNPAPMCGTLPYILGTLPNIFFQNSAAELRVELRHYQRLVNSGCSQKTAFFLCGTLMPYCIHTQSMPFSMPCREVCEEVHRDCSSTYENLYMGLPWPTKLECHRFPSTMNSSSDCIMS